MSVCEQEERVCIAVQSSSIFCNSSFSIISIAFYCNRLSEALNDTDIDILDDPQDIITRYILSIRTLDQIKCAVFSSISPTLNTSTGRAYVLFLQE